MWLHSLLQRVPIFYDEILKTLLKIINSPGNFQWTCKLSKNYLTHFPMICSPACGPVYLRSFETENPLWQQELLHKFTVVTPDRLTSLWTHISGSKRNILPFLNSQRLNVSLELLGLFSQATCWNIQSIIVAHYLKKQLPVWPQVKTFQQPFIRVRGTAVGIMSSSNTSLFQRLLM